MVMYLIANQLIVVRFYSYTIKIIYILFEDNLVGRILVCDTKSMGSIPFPLHILIFYNLRLFTFNLRTNSSVGRACSC